MNGNQLPPIDRDVVAKMQMDAYINDAAATLDSFDDVDDEGIPEDRAIAPAHAKAALASAIIGRETFRLMLLIGTTDTADGESASVADALGSIAATLIQIKERIAS